uniref:Uncharacterized protein n=1 Tax=Schistosoma japonicum TaxID=6182 RepID=Q5C0E6_SCHJA|nr:unknown [Schistosoma japonicum]
MADLVTTLTNLYKTDWVILMQLVAKHSNTL